LLIVKKKLSFLAGQAPVPSGFMAGTGVVAAMVLFLGILSIRSAKPIVCGSYDLL
jgi:hypothetical protein